jgi:hypothetical protein
VVWPPGTRSRLDLRAVIQCLDPRTVFPVSMGHGPLSTIPSGPPDTTPPKPATRGTFTENCDPDDGFDVTSDGAFKRQQGPRSLSCCCLRGKQYPAPRCRVRVRLRDAPAEPRVSVRRTARVREPRTATGIDRTGTRAPARASEKYSMTVYDASIANHDTNPGRPGPAKHDPRADVNP